MVVAVHLIFLVGVVLSAHHPAIFLGLLMMFIGFTGSLQTPPEPPDDQGRADGGLLPGRPGRAGGLQQWWLQGLLGDLPPTLLFWGSAALTAITDNAALTYLGSLVQGTSDTWRYMLVAGAVTGAA